jgi:hypothetical protein
MQVNFVTEQLSAVIGFAVATAVQITFGVKFVGQEVGWIDVISS